MLSLTRFPSMLVLLHDVYENKKIISRSLRQFYFFAAVTLKYLFYHITKMDLEEDLKNIIMK
jgi:hypothetical protein